MTGLGKKVNLISAHILRPKQEALGRAGRLVAVVERQAKRLLRLLHNSPTGKDSRIEFLVQAFHRENDEAIYSVGVARRAVTCVNHINTPGNFNEFEAHSFDRLD
jgi:hypothetical protein